MRFAKTIKQIQGLQAYHAGDKLNVEVDIVLDASTSLKDSHDLAYVSTPSLRLQWIRVCLVCELTKLPLRTARAYNMSWSRFPL
jgi:hypothetical protein